MRVRHVLISYWFVSTAGVGWRDREPAYLYSLRAVEEAS